MDDREGGKGRMIRKEKPGVSTLFCCKETRRSWVGVEKKKKESEDNKHPGILLHFACERGGGFRPQGMGKVVQMARINSSVRLLRSVTPTMNTPKTMRLRPTTLHMDPTHCPLLPSLPFSHILMWQGYYIYIPQYISQVTFMAVLINFKTNQTEKLHTEKRASKREPSRFFSPSISLRLLKGFTQGQQVNLWTAIADSCFPPLSQLLHALHEFSDSFFPYLFCF